MSSFLRDLYMISEGNDMDALPEDAMSEIQKNIRNGAKDTEQLWANALELVHKAYEVSGIQRPTPDMKGAWKQYEQNLQYAVEQLAKSRGIKGDWRMSAAVFHEALQKMQVFKVYLTSPGFSTSYKTQARSMSELLDYIEKHEKGDYEMKVIPKDDGTTSIRFSRYGVRVKYFIDIEPIGVVGVNI